MDRIQLTFDANDEVKTAVEANQDYICNEVLANGLTFGAVTKENNLVADLEEGDTLIELVKA
jgi:hypothetical protein